MATKPNLWDGEIKAIHSIVSGVWKRKHLQILQQEKLLLLVWYIIGTAQQTDAMWMCIIVTKTQL